MHTGRVSVRGAGSIPARSAMHKFDGSSGKKPSAEARRYVYAILAAMIDNDMSDTGQWFFGGLDNEVDRRRVRRAVKLVEAEMIRKGKS
jgi:hypothetical protein